MLPAKDYDDEAVAEESDDEDPWHEPAIDGEDETEGTQLGRGVHWVTRVRGKTSGGWAGVEIAGILGEVVHLLFFFYNDKGKLF